MMATMAPSREVVYFEVAYGGWKSDVDDGESSPAAMLEYVQLEGEIAVSRLGAIGFLQRWLDELEDELVPQALADGSSWSEIGRALGRSKQAVWAKHRVGPQPEAE